jgi:hypothetical protein
MSARCARRLGLFLLVVLLAACATQHPTGLQKQQLETEIIEGRYQDIFRAVRDVFLNEGYTIKVTEIKSGTLVFSKPAPAAAQKARQEELATALLMGPMIASMMHNKSATANKDDAVEVTVIITDEGEKSEIRTSFAGPGTAEDAGAYGTLLRRVYASVREQMMIKK